MPKALLSLDISSQKIEEEKKLHKARIFFSWKIPEMSSFFYPYRGIKYFLKPTKSEVSYLIHLVRLLALESMLLFWYLLLPQKLVAKTNNFILFLSVLLDNWTQ